MAKQDKQKVTRISASDEASKPKTAKKAVVAKARPLKAESGKKRSFGPLSAFGRYLKGAWVELRQVHWPTRRATWGLTGAVLIFSAFFVFFITALDAVFKFAFEQILGN